MADSWPKTHDSAPLTGAAFHFLQIGIAPMDYSTVKEIPANAAAASARRSMQESARLSRQVTALRRDATELSFGFDTRTFEKNILHG